MGDGGRGSTVFGIPTVRIPRCMQRLTQGGVIERQIARQRVDGRGGARPDPGDRLLHLVDQGLHITGITRIAHGQMQGKDEARRWLGDNPRLAAKLGGAVAFALANGRNGGIVGVDDFAVGQRLALRQPAGLVCDPVMGLERGRELGVQARPLLLRQLRRAVQALPGRPAPGAGPGCPSSSNCVSVWRTSVTNTFPIPRHWRPKRRITFWRSCWSCCACACSAVPLGGALRGYGRDDLEDFFWALYRVAASLTRWLPCSLGKVSTTRCAGLTRPVLHRGRRLDRQQFLHQRLIETTAKLGEHFREHKMLLGAIHLDLA